MRFLAHASRTIDLTTFQEVLASLRVYINIILEMRGMEPETAPSKLAEDTMLATLFLAPPEPQPNPRGRGKRHNCSLTTKGEDASVRASLIDEETC